jgi:phosphoribosylformimino-5-aminoimidazole carboxamide ribotide isomerase
MSHWEVYPAIDLRQGRVVRLRQGDPDRETAFGDPGTVAVRWQDAGARWLHVVNLDGALGEGGSRNRAALERILRAGMKVQFGGGLRDIESIRSALDVGVARAIIGTAAVEEPDLLRTALAEHGPERIAVAIDAREGRVRTRGWRAESDLGAAELAARCAELGARWFIHTDVARDGMGRGLDVEASRQIARGAGRNEPRRHVIASGGVASLEDVRRACQAGLSGVIIGRALYDGSVRLEDALDVTRRQSAPGEGGIAPGHYPGTRSGHAS